MGDIADEDSVVTEPLYNILDLLQSSADGGGGASGVGLSGGGGAGRCGRGENGGGGCYTLRD